MFLHSREVWRPVDTILYSMQHPALQVRDKLLAGLDQEYNVSDHSESLI